MSIKGAFGIRIYNIDKIVYNNTDSYWEELGRNIASDVIDYISSDDGMKYLKTKAKELSVVEDHNVYNLFEKGSFSSFIENGQFVDDRNFLYDSLFCEHAYIVNLDTEMFEIYKGLQLNEPKKSRYADKKPVDNGIYWGVELVNEIPLKCLKEFMELDEL